MGVCQPPYRATPLLFVLICENTQNLVPLVFHFWLIHYYKTTGEKKIHFWINQCWYWCLWSFIFDWFITTKPQERKRFIFGLINVGIGVCGLSFLIDSLLQNHRREKIHFWINPFLHWSLWYSPLSDNIKGCSIFH